MKVSGESLARRWGAAFDTQDAITLKEAISRGNIITEASPTFVADLRQRLKPVEDQWISNAKARNLADPAAVLAEFRKEIKKVQAETK